MVVIDASVAVAWCLPDESTPAAEHVRDLTFEQGGIVPPVFWSELANSLLVAQRRERVDAEGTATGIRLIHGLELDVDTWPEDRAQAVISLAARTNLSAYDASYLELASRRGVALATRDRHLLEAAIAAGCAVIEA